MQNNENRHHFILQTSIYTRLRICKEILLIFAVFFLPGLLWPQSESGKQNFNQIAFNLEILIIAVPQIGLLLHILGLESRNLVGALGLSIRGRGMLSYIIAGVVGLLAIAYAAQYAVNFGAGLIGGPHAVVSPQPAHWHMTTPVLLPFVLVSSIAIGYREEMFFRAYLILRLDQLGVAPATTVAASALLFSLGHIYEGLSGIVIAILAGLFLAILYRRLRNLHVVAIAHGIYNFIVLLLTLRIT